jgi:peroxiredoxin
LEDSVVTLKTDLEAVTRSVKEQIPADAFGAMEAANAKLAATGIASRALKKGQNMPEFELPDATGTIVRSRDLLAKGPLLISFYRGEWCPYCNLELKALQDRLADITAKGATLVGISPQTPDLSLSTQQKHALKFPVLSDANCDVARKFGLVFALDESLHAIYTAFGINLRASNGVDSWELPIPATYVVAKSGKIVEAFVDTDYRNRLEPDAVLGWLDRAG